MSDLLMPLFAKYELGGDLRRFVQRCAGRRVWLHDLDILLDYSDVVDAPDAPEDTNA